MKLAYFAWVRERIGQAEEMVEPPADIVTVADLLDWMKRRGPAYEAAFEQANQIRVAIDHEHAGRSAPISGAHEIAFFPPMTGG